MSTRSRIGIKREDGTIKSIYCHWDGYIEGVGKTLEKHYNDIKKIEELVELGDISALGSHYDEEISRASWGRYDIEDKVKRAELIQKSADCTIAYKDRPEDVPFRIDKDEDEFISKAGLCCEEFIYLYKKDMRGIYKWHILEVPYFTPLEHFSILQKGE